MLKLKAHTVLAASILLAAASLATSEDAWVLSRSKRATADIHSDKFCVDVSTFGPVTFDPTPREKCDTTFEKQCEIKQERVCDEVTEIKCDIVPYTECNMTMAETPYKSFNMTQVFFDKMVCEETMGKVQHLKMMPECRNVTKQNCITEWTTDNAGNKVWSKNVDCQPVTWRECKLVPRQVDFKVPNVTCAPLEQVPYTDCVEVTKLENTTGMTCEVKHTTSCEPVVSTKCQNIEYQECAELPVEKCETIDVNLPKQEKDHKLKCLLADASAMIDRPIVANSIQSSGAGDEEDEDVAAGEEAGQDDGEAPSTLTEEEEDALAAAALASAQLTPQESRQQQYRSRAAAAAAAAGATGRRFRQSRTFRGSVAAAQLQQQQQHQLRLQQRRLQQKQQQQQQHQQ